jgi:hypothetical protein
MVFCDGGGVWEAGESVEVPKLSAFRKVVCDALARGEEQNGKNTH